MEFTVDNKPLPLPLSNFSTGSPMITCLGVDLLYRSNPPLNLLLGFAGRCGVSVLEDTGVPILVWGGLRLCFQCSLCLLKLLLGRLFLGLFHLGLGLFLGLLRLRLHLLLQRFL